MAAPDTASQGWTTQQVARLLSLSPTEIRAWVKDGLVVPDRTAGGDLRFGFQHLVLLRTLHGLVRQLPRRKVSSALRQLRERAPDLAGLRLSADAGQVLVHDDDASWTAASGQLMLHFDAEPEAEPSELARLPEVTPLPSRPEAPSAWAPAPSDKTSDDWYASGCELEETQPFEARDHYLKSIELDPSHVDARVNLGRLYHVAEELDDAIVQYRAALVHEPDNVTAAFNLAVALEDQRDRPAALAVYEALIATDPTFPDAYYNAACLCEALDRPQDALRYLRQYRTLTRG